MTMAADTITITIIIDQQRTKSAPEEGTYRTFVRLGGGGGECLGGEESEDVGLGEGMEEEGGAGGGEEDDTGEGGVGS